MASNGGVMTGYTDAPFPTGLPPIPPVLGYTVVRPLDLPETTWALDDTALLTVQGVCIGGHWMIFLVVARDAPLDARVCGIIETEASPFGYDAALAATREWVEHTGRSADWNLLWFSPVGRLTELGEIPYIGGFATLTRTINEGE